MTIERLLVANRGEIARRVFRTCRTLGIGTVAVYTDVDASAPHVREADVAVRVASCLDSEALVAAARSAGADAVHPGYGFLSEDAGFAGAVTAAGLTWVGPSPEAIESMGSKVGAKKLMAAAGVPVLDALDDVTAGDLPVLVKASAGGGGRGMRIVRTLAELGPALDTARAEARSAFGDDAVFCEPYLERGRHIEVQVLADAYGTVWALGERECSIQRRHQKIVEETPSPMVSAELRALLCDAAVRAATVIGYTGAGTVEFLATADGRFWFLEMNTRLQVEHPVTECVTGLDLVAHQLEVAEGARLGPHPPQPRGHAIEVRLYAEDPADDWRPRPGTVHRFEVPGVDTEFANPPEHGLRLDSGVVDGSTVSVHYDSMLAKLIAWAPSRDRAARRLASALAGTVLHGVTTNRDLLVRVLRHPAFLDGDTDTAFLVRHDDLTAPLADRAADGLSALAAALADAAAERASATVQRGLPSGWRNVASQPQRRSYGGGRTVEYRLTRDGLVHDSGARLVSAAPHEVVLEADGVTRTFAVARYPGLVCVDSALGAVTLEPMDRFPDPATQVAAGSLLAPMPGAVVEVHVGEGDRVEAGRALVVLEAMKMRHVVAAPADGVVRSVRVSAGTQVEAGAVLAVVTGPSEEGQ